MSKIPQEYWLKWKEKLLSLFVSGKMYVFYTLFFSSTYLLIFNYITENIWLQTMIAGIGVMTLRGVIEFAEIKYNNQTTTILDNQMEDKLKKDEPIEKEIDEKTRLFLLFKQLKTISDEEIKKIINNIK